MMCDTKRGKRAATNSGGELLVEGGNVFDVDGSSPELGPVVPAVSAGADADALVASGHHGSSDEVNDGFVG